MSTNVAITDVVEVGFSTTANKGPGGWLNIEVKTSRGYGEAVGFSSVMLQTYDAEVFDHFRDIERVCNGPVGSLRAKPEGSEASDQPS